MLRLIPLLCLGFLFSCSDGGDTATVEVAPEKKDATGFTKEFEYAINRGEMYHPDLTDDDFSDVSALMVDLLNDVLAGKLKAYDPISEQELPLAQVRASLFVTDTLVYEDPDSGRQIVEAVTRDHGKQFHSVKFREQWRYAPDGAIIERRVSAIAPRIPVYSSVSGEIRGYTSLFWVKVK